MAKQVEQQASISNQVYETSSTTAVPTDGALGIVRYDPGQYSGPTLYFEVVLEVNGAARPMRTYTTSRVARS